MRRAPKVRALLPAALALPLLVACSSTVHVDAASSSSACNALVSSLPRVVAGAKSRTVEPADSGTAAWGKPAISLRCGVARPAGFSGVTQLLVVDGVAWLPEELSAGYRFTVETSAGYVQLDVPSAYSPASDALVDLAPAMRSAGARG